MPRKGHTEEQIELEVSYFRPQKAGKTGPRTITRLPNSTRLTPQLHLALQRENLSRLVNDRLLFVGGKYKTKTHLGSALFRH
jgi:hypothetical protein